MNPPIIAVKATNNSGEISIDVTAEDGYKVRVYGYKDHITSNSDWWVWPVLLGVGVHMLTGLEDNETYGIYAVVEDASTGDILSLPSSLQKVMPFVPVEHEIYLKRFPVTNYEVHGISAYRVQISVESANNVAKEVFVYHKEPITGLAQETVEAFSHVCSVADLAQFPTNTPLEGEPPYYRKSSIDVVEDTLEKIEAFWEDVKSWPPRSGQS